MDLNGTEESSVHWTTLDRLYYRLIASGHGSTFLLMVLTCALLLLAIVPLGHEVRRVVVSSPGVTKYRREMRDRDII